MIPYSDLLSFVDKTALDRAKFLESTEIFTDIHAAAAAGGQTAVPEDLNTDLHFTCFVHAPEASIREAEIVTGKRRLIELDGGRAGPVDRGESTDLLKVRVLTARQAFIRSWILTNICGAHHFSPAGRSKVCARADYSQGAELGI